MYTQAINNQLPISRSYNDFWYIYIIFHNHLQSEYSIDNHTTPLKHLLNKQNHSFVNEYVEYENASQNGYSPKFHFPHFLHCNINSSQFCNSSKFNGIYVHVFR